MKTINTLDPTPFRHLVTTIGELPSSFVESMSYYELLAWLCNYVEKTVLPAINDDTLAIKEIQHWIETLDLQDEVDHKLDEMVEDGTMATIINQEIFGELNDKIDDVDDKADNNTEAITTLTNSVNNHNSYTEGPLKYGKLGYPTEFGNVGFTLFRNVDGFITDDIDLTQYETTNLIHVNRDTGNDSTGDGSSANPYKTIHQALTAINSLGGNRWKIVCHTYRFFRDEFYAEVQSNTTYTMTKDVIIEPDDLTKQILVAPDQADLVWTSQGGGVFKTTRSNIYTIYNLVQKDVWGCPKELTKVNSLSACQQQYESYYVSGSDVYIHCNGGATPTTSTYCMPLKLSVCKFRIHNNRFLRLRNITFLPYYDLSFTNESSDYENGLICENVNIFGMSDSNGFTVDNVKTVYMFNCTTTKNYLDGFNYHYTSMNPTNAIVYENNCKSYYNGFDYDRNICNGSTIHEGGRIIRANCVYQDTHGPAVADINSSKTYMLHCRVNQESDYRAFDFENSENETTGLAVLVDCSSLQTQTLSLYGSTGFTIKLKKFEGNYTNPNLDISLYDE